jgi:hypothetical protein
MNINLTEAYIKGILQHPETDCDASTTEVESATKFLHQVLYLVQLDDRTARNMIVKAARHIGGKA